MDVPALRIALILWISSSAILRFRPALRACKEKYQGVARKGVEAIELKLQGYESVEIADLYGTTVNNVNAWISRARSKLRNEPALMEILC